MLETKKVPNSFLENINIINTATNFFNSNKDISDINTLYNKTTNYCSNFNTNNSKLNTLNINRIDNNKLNEKKKFVWKDIINLDYNKYNNDEKILEDPLINNILNSDINENEIQNMPENYLVNLIHTLQGLANNAIKNKAELELENKRLYHDLENMKTNNEYLHQSNMRTNQKLIKLKKQNNEQKKAQNLMSELFLENNKYIKNKKYYCHICTNKKFKSQLYLDEHIARRHPDYPQKILKQKINKENKSNIALYHKKLNEMKNYCENLIYKSIKKIQYIKINEKLNSLQYLLEISKFINNANITNTYQENTNIELNENDSNERINNKNKNINNINKKITKQEKDEKDKEKKSETENNSSLGLEKSEDTNKKKQNELIEKRHGIFLHNYLLLKKEIRFIEIKNSFEKQEEIKTHQRRKKKTKTLKMKNRSKLEVTDSTDEQKTNEQKKKTEIKEEKKEPKEEYDKLKAKNENINEIDKPKEENKKDKEKINLNEEKEEYENSPEKKFKLREENIINFSGKEEEEKNILLKQFAQDFRRRDNDFCLQEEKYFLKKVLPKDYKLDNKKVDNIVKEKINSKMVNYNFEGKTIKQIRTKMMNIYYDTFDIKEKFGDMYLFSYINISSLMDIKNLMVDANNNNFYFEDGFLETVKYKLQGQEYSENYYNGDETYENMESQAFSFGNNNNE